MVNRNSPLVSIVTPSYNQGKFIEQTLLSVKNQDYPNIEHIVVDGESSDYTLSILKKYESLYNLKWLSEPDHGQADAINKGFEIARGDIIGWLNSDDVYFYRDTVSFIVKEFKHSLSSEVIYGDVVSIDEEGLILRIRLDPEFNHKQLLHRNFIAQPSTFFKRSVIQKYKLDIQVHLAMDYEYWLRLSSGGTRFKHVQRILSGARVHGDMKSNTRSRDMERETKEVKSRYGQKFERRYYQLKKLNKVRDTLSKISGIPKIMTLFVKNDKSQLAFSGQYDSIIRVLLRQLFFTTRLRTVFWSHLASNTRLSN